MSMHDPFGYTGGARCIHDVRQVLFHYPGIRRPVSRCRLETVPTQTPDTRLIDHIETYDTFQRCPGVEKLQYILLLLYIANQATNAAMLNGLAQT